MPRELHSETFVTLNRPSDEPKMSLIESILSLARPALPVMRSIARGHRFALLQLFILTISLLPALTLLVVLAETIWKPLPYRRPDQLFVAEAAGPALEEIERGGGPGVATPAIAEAGLFTSGEGSLLTASGRIERLKFAVVSRTFLSALGPPMIIGSFPGATQVASSAGRPVVISERLWKNAFGAARDVMGQSCVLNDLPARIYGVVREADMPLPDTDAWLVRQRREDGAINGVIWYTGLVRLRDGSTPWAAAQQLAALGRSQSGASIAPARPLMPVVEYRFKDQQLGIRTAAWVVACLFLVGLVNSVSIYCSELLRTQRDMALKLAIGSSFLGLARDVIVRQQVYSVASWLIAALFTPTFASGIAAFEHLDAGGFTHRLPTLMAMGVGLGVLMVAGAAIAIAQLWIIKQVNLSLLLQEGSQTIAGARRGRLVQNSMLFLQVTMSTGLLAASGYVVQVYRQQARTELGFSVKNVLTMDVQFPAGGVPPEQRRAALANLISALRERLPANSVGAVNYVPLDRKHSIMLSVQRSSEAEGEGVFAGYRVVTGDYFAALGIPILKGRAFNHVDNTASGPCRTIVSTTLARRMGIERNPQGQRLRIAGFNQTCEVIGMSGDVRFEGPGEQPEPEFYLDYSAAPSRFMTLVVKCSQNAEGLITAARKATESVGGGIASSAPSTMGRLLAIQLQPQRERAAVIAAVAMLAILLAQLGLYGLVARTVLNQAMRIGIELALGGTRLAIARRTLGWLMTAVAGAIGCGLVIAFVGLRRVNYMGGSAPEFALVVFPTAAVMISISAAAAYAAAASLLRREPLQVMRWSRLLG